MITVLVERLKEANEDHEFYPTTDEIISALSKDIENASKAYSSVLDIGAGNGKVLKSLRGIAGFSDLHAIEKSSILCSELDPDILIVGTDFHQQSLLSKEVDVVFCNPPYSEFEEWVEKIVRQSGSSRVYLVIPIRWQNSIRIKDALAFRETEARVIGKFDFEDADRSARATVHLICVEFGDSRYEKDDPFERHFNEQFEDLITKFKASESRPEGEKSESESSSQGKPHDFHSLVVGPNYPEALVKLYGAEMDKIQNNYRLVAQLDVSLLNEFKIDPQNIMGCLKARLSGLKNDYWMELFSHLTAITDRLTSQSRKSLLDKLHRHVQVDFTVSNIYEIVLWVIKNANGYIDSQLISTYELMVAKCNVALYKSNQRTWVENHWRYGRNDKDLNSHYALDYRIVTHRIGGLTSRFGDKYKLDESAANFIGDLRTLARNLGFTPLQNDSLWRLDYRGCEDWRSGQNQEFFFNGKDGAELLFDVKAFKNRNLHLRLNKDFMLALNVEHGRLRGWIRNAREAVEELQDDNAAKYFNGNHRITGGSQMLLLTA